MGKRQRTDPNAPKAYKSAYLHFAADRRQEILKHNPDMDCQQVSKELGRIWKTMTDSEKRPWMDVAGHDRARYEAEMKNYNNPLLREANLLGDTFYLSREAALATGLNAPKPAKSAYIHFWSDKREEVLRMNPDIGFKDVAKAIGTMWREMSPEEKQPWVDLAEADKRRYDEELELCVQPAFRPPPPKKKRKDPNAPKGPKTGFQFLLDHKREDMEKRFPEAPYNVLSQEVGKIWRSMTEQEKAPWNELARNDKARYEAEMLNYRPPRYLDIDPSFDKRQKLRDILKKDPLAPRPPKGAYAFYAAAKREELQGSFPDMQFGEIMKNVGASWKEMPLEEKKPWTELADADKQRYESELRNYKFPKLSSAAARTFRESENSSRKKSKDPHAPKTPKSAFVHFQAAKRDLIMGSKPDMTYNEFSQEVGRLWRGMSEEEKTPWKEIATEDKARYDAEMINYKPSRLHLVESEDDDFNFESNGKRKARAGASKKSRDPEMPKPAKTAYLFLFQEKKDEVMNSRPGVTYNECSSQIGKMWRSMTPEEKQPWLQLAAEDKLRYEHELEELRMKRSNIKKKKSNKRDPNAPKPAKSAFMYVLDAKRDEILREQPNLTYNQLTQEVAKIWNSLSDADKMPWKDLAAEDKARYDAEMSNYEPYMYGQEMMSTNRLKHQLHTQQSSSSTSASLRRNTAKRKREVNAPRAPKSAFTYFSSEKQDEISRQQPDLALPDRMKRVGNIWNEMNSEDKYEWVEKARNDKMRFDKEMMEYTGGQNAYV